MVVMSVVCFLNTYKQLTQGMWNQVIQEGKDGGLKRARAREEDDEVLEVVKEWGGISVGEPKVFRGVQAQGANGVEALQNAKPPVDGSLIEETLAAVGCCAQSIIVYDLSTPVLPLLKVCD